MTPRSPMLPYYLDDIKRYPILDDPQGEEMVLHNLRFVVWVAKRYWDKTDFLEDVDLIQEGNIGLIDAAGRFDPSRGVKFTSYAFWWIRQCMVRAIQNQENLIRLPAQSKHYEDLPRADSFTDLINEEDGQEIADFLETFDAGGLTPEERVVLKDTAAVICEQIDAVLTERQREAFWLRLALDENKQRTYREVGALMGCSHKNARMMYRAAVATLNTRMTALLGD